EQEFVRNINGQGSVHFLGERADPSLYLARSDIVWIADGSATGALSAMAAGKPVAAWKCPALEDIVGEGKTGILVPPGRQAELARETRLLLDDPQRRAEWGEAGRQRARDNFAPEELVCSTARLYQELVANDKISLASQKQS